MIFLQLYFNPFYTILQLNCNPTRQYAKHCRICDSNRWFRNEFSQGYEPPNRTFQMNQDNRVRQIDLCFPSLLRNVCDEAPPSQRNGVFPGSMETKTVFAGRRRCPGVLARYQRSPPFPFIIRVSLSPADPSVGARPPTRIDKAGKKTTEALDAPARGNVSRKFIRDGLTPGRTIGRQ